MTKLIDTRKDRYIPYSGGGNATSNSSNSTSPQVRVYHDANQQIGSVSGTFLSFNSERFDTDDMHYTSSANLTGTVAKSASSTTLTGTGTAFLTELSVGQVINVPGTATETRVVTDIASNTSLTVAVAFANSATGQTAARVNGALVARTAGLYYIAANAEWETSGTNGRLIIIALNPLTTAAFAGTSIATEGGQATNGFTHRNNVSVIYPLEQWDYVRVTVYQDSGGNLNVNASSNTSPEFMMVRLSASS